MLRIRLARFGRRHRPFFRIVVTEARRPRDGKYIEVIGTYDPLAKKGEKVSLNKERYDYWLKHGAQPSDAVLKLVLPVEEKKKLWPDKPKKGQSQSSTSNGDANSSDDAGNQQDSTSTDNTASDKENTES